MSTHALNRTSNTVIADALLNDKGTPEFIAECKAAFNERVALMNRKHDPSVSQHNINNLRACMADPSMKLDLLTTKR